MKVNVFKFAVAAVLGAATMFTACKSDNEPDKPEGPVKVTGVSLNKTSLSLVVGGGDQLIASVLPAEAANKSVAWTSDHAGVAMVDNNGNVTARSAGSAVITVTTADGGKTAGCEVTVAPAVFPAESITLGAASAALTVGENYVLTATVVPANTTDAVIWTSSDNTKASVANGVVTAHAEGNAAITAQAGSKTATCRITVKDGIKINGVIWAKYNVNAPNTFAATPESAGMFYQWNRKTAWASTGNVTGWDASTPAGTEWTKANDPSPAGWRVPTSTEIRTLLGNSKVSSVWASQNGVNGSKFTDLQNGNTLFLPLVGRRYYSDGTLSNTGTYGFYWSSTQGSSGKAYCLYFPELSDEYRSYGYSVRPVAE